MGMVSFFFRMIKLNYKGAFKAKKKRSLFVDQSRYLENACLGVCGHR